MPRRFVKLEAGSVIRQEPRCVSLHHNEPLRIRAEGEWQL
jgi:hypothetical protein